jgi:predicted RND superfamily exporter protein
VMKLINLIHELLEYHLGKDALQNSKISSIDMKQEGYFNIDHLEELSTSKLSVVEKEVKDIKKSVFERLIKFEETLESFNLVEGQISILKDMNKFKKNIEKKVF